MCWPQLNVLSYKIVMSEAIPPTSSEILPIGTSTVELSNAGVQEIAGFAVQTFFNEHSEDLVLPDQPDPEAEMKALFRSLRAPDGQYEYTRLSPRSLGGQLLGKWCTTTHLLRNSDESSVNLITDVSIARTLDLTEAEPPKELLAASKILANNDLPRRTRKDLRIRHHRLLNTMGESTRRLFPTYSYHTSVQDEHLRHGMGRFLLEHPTKTVVGIDVNAQITQKDRAPRSMSVSMLSGVSIANIESGTESKVAQQLRNIQTIIAHGRPVNARNI
jgi:hypothetical protein